MASVALGVCLGCTHTSRPPAPDPSGAGTRPDIPEDVPASVAPGDLSLHISRNDAWEWDAVITNHGSLPVLAVAPGDGSDVGWRTPTLEWHLETSEGIPIDSGPSIRCGNMNPLAWSELLVIGPGESVSFRLAGPSDWSLETPYYATLELANDPQAEWQGVLLGPHEEGALAALRRSTAFSLRSNRLRVDEP